MTRFEKFLVAGIIVSCGVVLGDLAYALFILFLN